MNYLYLRHKLGLAFNETVRNGELSAPVVIGRDYLDSGSVASPNRETESMQDGSDAVSDWPLLKAMLNVASGATWVSLHHGGGVGMGYSPGKGDGGNKVSLISSVPFLPAMHAVLCAAGYNLHWLLRAIVRRGIKPFFLCLWAWWRQQVSVAWRSRSRWFTMSESFWQRRRAMGTLLDWSTASAG